MAAGPPDLPFRAGLRNISYSGKTRRHTLKTQIVTDKHGEVLAIEPGHPGPWSDKTLYAQSVAAGQYPRAARRADLTYHGVPEMLLPHKRKRGKAGEKAKALTLEQKAQNRHQASQRVYVEHGVRRCKAWRIPRDEFRLGRGLSPLVVLATVGLVH